jgi:hypothetical protein
MTQNRYSSPIPASIPDEDNAVVLEKKGEIKHHELIVKY